MYKRKSLKLIKELCRGYEEWCIMNKYHDFEYEIIDCREKFNINDVIVLHNLEKENGINLSVSSGSEFIQEVFELINEIADDKFLGEYTQDFWIEKIDKILNEAEGVC